MEGEEQEDLARFHNEDGCLQTEIFNLKRLIANVSEEEEEDEEEGEDNEDDDELKTTKNHYTVDVGYLSNEDDAENSGCQRSKYMDSECGVSFDGESSSLVSDMPQSLETCLALNQAYQEILQDAVSELEKVLSHNQAKQKTLREQLVNPESARYASPSNMKIGRLAAFLQPYFRDVHGFPAPENADVTLKRANRELNAYITRPRGWNKAEVTELEKAVHRNALKLAMKSLIDKKEYFLDKIRDQTLLNKDEIAAAKKAIKDAEEQMAVIQSYSIEELVGSRETKLDWLHISNVDMMKDRTPEECELFWKNYLHPSINKADWTPEEDSRLKDLVDKWQGRNWDAVAEELRTNRTALQCLERYKTIDFPSKQKGHWAAEEDDLLLEVVKSCAVGNFVPWHQVAYYFDGRSKFSLRSRWERLQGSGKKYWSLEEDMLLLALVRKHQYDWKKIATYFEHRNNQQCRERYHNTLSEEIERRPFSQEEDNRLVSLVESLGTNWVRLCDFFPGRNDNQLLQRYKRLQKLRTETDNNSGDEMPTVRNRNCYRDNRDTAEKLLNLKAEAIKKELKAEAKGEEVDERMVEDLLIKELQKLTSSRNREMERRKAVSRTQARNRAMLRIKYINQDLIDYFRSRIHFSVLQQNKKGLWLPRTSTVMLDGMTIRVWKRFKLNESEIPSEEGLDPPLMQCGYDFIDKYLAYPEDEDDSGVQIFPPNVSTVTAFESLLINRPYLQQKASQSSCDTFIDLMDQSMNSVCCMDFNNVFDEIVFDQWMSGCDSSELTRDIVEEPNSANASSQVAPSLTTSGADNEVHTSAGVQECFQDGFQDVPMEGNDNVRRRDAKGHSNSLLDDVDGAPNIITKSLSWNTFACVEHDISGCQRCTTLQQFCSDYKLLEDRFIAIFLWPALLSMVNPPSDIGVVENAPTEKEPKKKRSYKPNRRIKRPWCRDLALRNAELRKARSAMRRELEEKAKSEQLTTSETEAQATSAQPSANEPESLVTPGTSTEGVDSEVPPRRKRGRPKGYSPRNKKVVVNRKPRGPTQKKPDNLEPIRRSTRVAEKRKFVENEVPPIVKKLKLDLQAAMHILGKS